VNPSHGRRGRQAEAASEQAAGISKYRRAARAGSVRSIRGRWQARRSHMFWQPGACARARYKAAARPWRLRMSSASVHPGASRRDQHHGGRVPYRRHRRYPAAARCARSAALSHVMAAQQARKNIRSAAAALCARIARRAAYAGIAIPREPTRV